MNAQDVMALTISTTIFRSGPASKFKALELTPTAFGPAPSKRHGTKDEAITEAGRLAQQTNARYFVLEVVGAVAPVKYPVAYAAIDG